MALDFERASSQWVDMGLSLPALNGKSAATVMAWIKLESAAATMGVLATAIGAPPGTSAASRLTLEIRSSRRIQIVVRPIDGGGSVTLLSATALTLGVWAHIVGVVDIANDIFEIWIDGALDASSTPSFTPVVWPSTNAKNAAIGSNPDGSAEFLDGVIEDARQYSRRVLAGEIVTIHTVRGVDGIPADHRFPLNEKNVGATASGLGSIKDLGSEQRNSEPNASPVYAAGVIRSRRKVA